MIPALMNGLLPPGIHPAALSEVRAAFGWNDRRTDLLAGLERVLRALSQAGCSRAWLDGSFVTDKDMPGDFDLVWELDDVDLDLIDPVILDIQPPRTAQQIKYGGDLLPNVIEVGSGMPFLDFFQQDKYTGNARGIIELRLEVPN